MAAKRGGRRAKYRKRRRAALLPKILVLLVLASALAWRLHSIRVQVEDAKAERDRLTTEVEDMRRKNDALDADIQEGVTQEKLEEMARDQLGVVKRDEYVFITGN